MIHLRNDASVERLSSVKGDKECYASAFWQFQELPKAYQDSSKSVANTELSSATAKIQDTLLRRS